MELTPGSIKFRFSLLGIKGDLGVDAFSIYTSYKCVEKSNFMMTRYHVLGVYVLPELIHEVPSETMMLPVGLKLTAATPSLGTSRSSEPMPALTTYSTQDGERLPYSLARITFTGVSAPMSFKDLPLPVAVSPDAIMALSV